jgi:hypothetical protein
MNFVSALYKFARLMNTISKLTSPAKTGRRAKNIAVGRIIGRLTWRLYR